jgi:hypothetical protein
LLVTRRPFFDPLILDGETLGYVEQKTRRWNPGMVTGLRPLPKRQPHLGIHWFPAQDGNGDSTMDKYGLSEREEDGRAEPTKGRNKPVAKSAYLKYEDRTQFFNNTRIRNKMEDRFNLRVVCGEGRHGTSCSLIRDRVTRIASNHSRNQMRTIVRISS